jgi:hypothetical protein
LRSSQPTQSKPDLRSFAFDKFAPVIFHSVEPILPPPDGAFKNFLLFTCDSEIRHFRLQGKDLLRRGIEALARAARWGQRALPAGLAEHWTFFGVGMARELKRKWELI